MLFHANKKPIELQIINLNQKQEVIKKKLEQASLLNQKGACKKLCQLKKAKKQKNKDSQKNDNIVYVLDFIGDIKASAAEKLREEISAIISTAKAGDEVVIRLESAGGQVHGYGLAAAQLARIKDAGLTLTVCVDKVAASGGYMMACVADKIVATPFAIIGSIGVVSQMPNFHEFLKKHDIDIELFTAGEYKRTVTVFGENTDEGRAKYQSELERIHVLFQEHVATYRPTLDIHKVATGEFWFGVDAKELNLIDELGSSDSYLMEKINNQTVLALHSQQKPTLAQKLGLAEMGVQLTSQLATLAKNNVPLIDKLTSRLPM